MPASVRLYQGNGTVSGLIKNLKRALLDREYDIVHVHSPHLGVLFWVVSWLFNRRLQRRAVYTIHSSFPNYRLRHRRLLLFIMLVYRRIVCCSQSSYDSVPQLHRWLAGRRLELIPNGVNLDRIDRVLPDR